MRDAIADMATSGTDHFGEVMLVVGSGATKHAEQRVSTPHLWEGALFYLTSMALEDPAALTKYDEVLPPSRVPAPGALAAAGSGGCGCVVAGGARGGSPVAPLALGVALTLLAATRRRRR